MIRMKKIGIIGGMGPESTVMFYKEIIRIFQEEYGAKYDSDYPEMWICNFPIPDIVKGINDSGRIREMLSVTSKKLEWLGADFIAVPCNTVNLFFDSIQGAVSVPVLNIIKETEKKIESLGFKKVGLLATETLIKSGLYGKYLEKYGIGIVKPDKNEMREVSGAIMKILNGEKEPDDKRRIMKIAERFMKEGAGCIILGCTDLPVLVKEEDFGIKTLNTIKILAEASVNRVMSGDGN